MLDEAPFRPRPNPVILDRKKTSIAVLDLSKRDEDPNRFTCELVQRVAAFLEKARTYEIPIIYTVVFNIKGTPAADLPRVFNRRETEPIIYPEAFDKFTGGELQDFLKLKNTNNFIVVGAATNNCVLYTSSAAAYTYRQSVILPLDGVLCEYRYRQEYALHQLAVGLPPSVTIPIRFTKLALITFSGC